MESVLTTCPFCACGCGLYLHARDGRPSGAAPSENHPVSNGKLCARGWNAHEAPSWGERLTRPLVRRGKGLEPASWEDALKLAHASLAALVKSGNRVGVLGSARATNEENYLAARLARRGLRTSHLDSCLRATYQPVVEGLAAVGGAGPAGTLADVETSGCVLVLEGDLAVTHPQAGHAVIRAVKAGAALITSGPAKTQLARLATIHLPSPPGGREGLLAGLVAALVELTELELAPQRLPGMKELKASLASTPISEPMRLAVKRYLEAERASVLAAPEGNDPERAAREGRALATLAALAGHLRRPGSAILPLPARGNLRGACEMGVGPDRVGGSAAGLDAAAMVREAPGVVVVADDPAAVLPDGSGALAALAEKECLVVLDAFLTQAARAARVVLPIASFAENEGTVTSLDGRVQRIRPIALPPGDARQGWRVLAELAALFGLPNPYRSADDVLGEISGSVPSYAGVGDAIEDAAWGVPTGSAGARGEIKLEAIRLAGNGREEGAVLALDGVFDWGSDPLVSHSPTLSRDHLSQRRLNPRGLVQMSASAAERLGVRQGWPVRVASAYGEAVLPVALRDDLEAGVTLVPYAFRDRVAAVFGGRSEVVVNVERVQ